MKKIFIYILCIVMVAMLIGCTKNDTISTPDEKINVVTTIYPIYDWVKNVGKDNVEVIYLLDNGVDLHNYQVNAEDILKINNSDLFIYVGGESDEWVEDVLKDNTKTKTLNLMDEISDNLKEEELIEGMMDEEEEGDEDCEGIEYDEHIWLSLKNAIKCVDAINSRLCEIDKKNMISYDNNAKNYIAKLSNLDDKFTSNLSNIVDKNKIVVFGDRFPFRYFVDDYGIKYFAAFKGCSAETEASFETIKFLSEKIDEEGLTDIFIIEGSDGKIAKSIIDSTENKDMNIRIVNSLQSINKNEIDKTSYIDIMSKNLEVFEEVLCK